jgi:DNA-directed RNA polymerase specialized sigma24 family protein
VNEALADWCEYVETLLEATPARVLTDGQREALALRLDGWSYGQVGEMLGVAKGTAQSRVRGAVKTMEGWVARQEARRARLLMLPPP